VLVVIATQSISIGTDCDNDHMTQVFGVFNSGGDAFLATEAQQMSFRVRKAERIDIFFKNNVRSWEPTTREGMKNWACRASNCAAIPPEYRNELIPGMRTNTTLDPEGFDRMYKGVFEPECWFLARLNANRSATNPIYRYWINVSRIVKNITITELTKETTKQKDEYDLSVYKAIAKLEYAQLMVNNIEEHIDTRIPPKNDNEVAGRQAQFILETFDWVNPNTVTPEEMMHYAKYVRQESLRKFVSTADKVKIDRTDYVSADDQARITSVHERKAVIKILTKMLGIDAGHKSTEMIKIETLKNPEFVKYITALAKDTKRVFGFVVKECADTLKYHTTILNNVFINIGLGLRQHRKRIHNKKTTIGYDPSWHSEINSKKGSGHDSE
jgi:hypothetical protein